MDQVQKVLRYHHYAYRAETTYCQMILSYIRFPGGKTHPKLLGATYVERFLTHLATNGKVAVSTQRHALVAKLLYGAGLRQMVCTWRRSTPSPNEHLS